MNRPSSFPLLLVALSTSPPGLAIVEDPIAIVGCHVIAMDRERVDANATVVVSGGTIRTIGAVEDVRVPENARVIDARGAWMLPGLTDAHVHLAHESERLLYVRHGVTTVWNLGGDGLDLFSGERLEVLTLRDRILAGELIGPEIYSTGRALDGDPRTGPFQTALPDEAAADAAVREHVDRGFDFIKVYDAMPAAVHAAVIRAAREADVAVFGHVPNGMGVEATLASGQAVIAHAEEYFGAYEVSAAGPPGDVRRLAAATREAGVVVIPNISFIRNVLLQIEDLDARLARPEVAFVAPSVKRWWTPRYNYLLGRPDMEAFEAQMREKLGFVDALTAALHREGVLLLAGSDASVPTAVPGLALHEELAALVEAGLTPYEALRTATVHPDRFFAEHLPDQAGFGTIQVGRRANLLLLDRNPLESIEHLAGVRGVMVRGRWFEREGLDEALARAAEGFAD